MKYYLYQITNLVNAKIYVGVHKTKNLDDGYMGSGKVISAAILKHGAENFKKDILEHFDTSEAMYAKEKEIVTDEFLLREDTYNLRRGGTGGFDYINKNELFLADSETRREFNIKHSPFANREKYTTEEQDEWKRKAKENGDYTNGISAMRKFHKEHPECALKNFEKLRTPEAIAKRRATLEKIGHQQGSKNSQFGTMWINNGAINKKMKKDKPIPAGWDRGRKIAEVSKQVTLIVGSLDVIKDYINKL